MINYLVKTFINKHVPKPEGSRYAEDIISDSRMPLAYNAIAATSIAKSFVGDAVVLNVPQEKVENTLYFECRDLFKTNLQQSKLRREQLIYIDSLLDEMLGDKKRYHNRKYQNICHSMTWSSKIVTLCIINFHEYLFSKGVSPPRKL